MPAYRADFLKAIIGTAVTVGSHGASSGTRARRHRVLEISFASEDPSDAMCRVVGTRYTAAGTSTAVVPTPLDMADDAFLGVAGEAHSIEPTYTVGPPPLIVFSEEVHFRAPARYYPPPGREIVIPATNAAGVGYTTPDISAGTPSFMMAVILEE